MYKFYHCGMWLEKLFSSTNFFVCAHCISTVSLVTPHGTVIKKSSYMLPVLSTDTDNVQVSTQQEVHHINHFHNRGYGRSIWAKNTHLLPLVSNYFHLCNLKCFLFLLKTRYANTYITYFIPFNILNFFKIRQWNPKKLPPCWHSIFFSNTRKICCVSQ